MANNRLLNSLYGLLAVLLFLAIADEWLIRQYLKPLPVVSEPIGLRPERLRSILPPQGTELAASISLTGDVSGNLTIANGGTGLTTFTTGDVIFSSGTLSTGTIDSVLTSTGAGIPMWSDSPDGPRCVQGHQEDVVHRISGSLVGRIRTADRTYTTRQWVCTIYER